MKMYIKIFLNLFLNKYHKYLATVVVLSLMSSTIQTEELTSQKRQVNLIDEIQDFKKQAVTTYENIESTTGDVDLDLKNRDTICLSKISSQKKYDKLLDLNEKTNTDLKKALLSNVNSNTYFGDNMRTKTRNLLDYVDNHSYEFQNCTTQANNDLNHIVWSEKKVDILHIMKTSKDEIQGIKSNQQYSQYLVKLNDESKNTKIAKND